MQITRLRYTRRVTVPSDFSVRLVMPRRVSGDVSAPVFVVFPIVDRCLDVLQSVPVVVSREGSIWKLANGSIIGPCGHASGEGPIARTGVID